MPYLEALQISLMKELVEYLGARQKGPISDTTKLGYILADCWQICKGIHSDLPDILRNIETIAFKNGVKIK